MKFYFDILIALCICITALPAVVLLFESYTREKSWEYTHKKISRTIAIFLLGGTTILIWGSFIEPKILLTHEQTIDINGIDKPITIAFVADYQIGPYKQMKWVQKTVNQILKLNPDIVLIGGDTIDNGKFEDEAIDYLEPLRQLTQKIPVYAIHGNHEYGIGGGKSIDDSRYRHPDVSKKIQQRLEELGVTYLIIELTLIEIDGQNIYLFGGDEYWTGNLDFSALDTRQEKHPTVGLIHNPTFALETRPQDVEIWFSGHTHGGQIRLPFIGPLGRVDTYLPKEYYQGLHQLGMNKEYLFVTSGIGETGTRARLFNPPEITLITLK